MKSSIATTPAPRDHLRRPNVSQIVDALAREATERPQWTEAIGAFRCGNISLHLAIAAEPYLQYIVEGRKTVESRFSTHRIAPFGQVHCGDVVLFKRVSGPIVAAAFVTAVHHYRLNQQTWPEILERFGSELCISKEFVSERRRSLYATLMRIADVRTLPPMSVERKDRRAWVILQPRLRQIELF